MHTLLVSGRQPPPDDLKAILAKGSTSLDEVSVDDLTTFVSREGLGVDRIVFWAGGGDHDVKSLAWNYATSAGADRRQTIVFVSDAPSDPIDGMGPDEPLIWPRDRDKLVMIFMS